MIAETKDERLARGHPVGQDVPYQAMGGLTGFSSLMDGYMRLDPSGIGIDLSYAAMFLHHLVIIFQMFFFFFSNFCLLEKKCNKISQGNIFTVHYYFNVN